MLRSKLLQLSWKGEYWYGCFYMSMPLLGQGELGIVSLAANGGGKMRLLFGLRLLSASSRPALELQILSQAPNIG